MKYSWLRQSKGGPASNVTNMTTVDMAMVYPAYDDFSTPVEVSEFDDAFISSSTSSTSTTREGETWLSPKFASYVDGVGVCVHLSVDAGLRDLGMGALAPPLSAGDMMAKWALGLYYVGKSIAKSEAGKITAARALMHEYIVDHLPFAYCHALAKHLGDIDDKVLQAKSRN